MLKVFDTSHEQQQPLFNYEGLCLTQEISGEDTLTFTVPKDTVLQEEWYVQTKDNEYVIKEKSLDTTSDTVKITALINVEDLKATPIKLFTSETKTPYSAISLALAYCPNSWTIVSSISKKRTLELSQSSVWDIVQEALDLYIAELKVDAINHVLYMETALGEDKGSYFVEDLNLQQLSVDSDTHDLVTRIYPIGKDGLTIEEVTDDGVDYVENYTYTDKLIAMYWEDNRYTIAENLMEDAIEKLETLSQPSRSYTCSVTDLANLKGYDILDFDIGDEVTLISESAQINQKFRIIKLNRYLDEPENTTCTLSTDLPNLVDYIQQAADAYTTVQSITTADGNVDSSKVTSTSSSGDGGGYLPEGGSEGQALLKASSADYDVEWGWAADEGSLTFEEVTMAIQIATEDIEDAAITNAKIGNAAITNANIADSTITGSKIVDATITTAKIADAAITSAKIEAAAITGAHIETATIDTSHLIDASITSAKIADAAITTEKVEDSSITNAKIADASITTAKIEDAAITEAKITDASITSAKIGDAQISTAHIQDGSITTAKIGSLDASVITSGTLATERLIIYGEDENGETKSIVYTINSANNLDDDEEISSTTIDGYSITASSITGSQIAPSTITSSHIVSKTLALGLFTDDSINNILDSANDYTDTQIETIVGQYMLYDSTNGLTIGAAVSDFSVNLTNDELGFYYQGNKVAYIDSDDFYIENGKVTGSLGIGNWYWQTATSTGNLELIYKES